jgi:lactoylglutathione lyase
LTSPGGVTGANHTGVQVSNLDRSIAFYRDMLGCELVTQWVRNEPYIGTVTGYPGATLRIAVLKVRNSETLIELAEYQGVERSPVDPATANPGTGHLALNVENLLSFYKALREQGVRTVSEPVTPTVGPNKGGKVVYILDPDGVRIELIESQLTLAGTPKAPTP